MEHNKLFELLEIYDEACWYFMDIGVLHPSNLDADWEFIQERLMKLDVSFFENQFELLINDKTFDNPIKFIEKKFITPYDEIMYECNKIFHKEIKNKNPENFTLRQQIIFRLSLLGNEIFECFEKLKALNTSTYNGFNSSLDTKQIESLYNCLSNKYIDKSVSFKNFKCIFQDKPLPMEFKKIEWKKPHSKILLAYFINKIFYNNNPFDYWSKAKNIFINAENLKSSLGNNPKPKGYEQIDRIIQTIYNP